MDFQNPVETFAAGKAIKILPAKITKEEIVEFASEFDPAFFHLDEEKAKNSLLGGLAASGFHTCAVAMRMICDSFLLQTTSQGAAEVHEISWLVPVRPDDTLSGQTVVLEGRRSNSRQNIWIAKVRHEILNQNNEMVLTMTVTVMFAIPEAAA